MEINFRVGTQEQHDVHFSWDQLTTGVRITVDGVEVVKTIATLTVSLKKTFEFPVGVEEKHLVRFDLKRTLFLSQFRPNTVTVILDGQVVDQRTSDIMNPEPQPGQG